MSSIKKIYKLKVNDLEKQLSITNKELAFQNDEKEKRADELVVANKELAFQNDEKEKRADELVVANKELAFQNDEKEKRADELVVANMELAFQNNEKEKRANELKVAIKELTLEKKRTEELAKDLLEANKELAQKSLDDLLLVGNIFENSIKNAPIPIMIHAEDGIVINISQEWTNLTKYTKSDIPTIFDWTSKAYGQKKEDVIEFIKKLYKVKEKQHDGEFVVTTKDGRLLTWDFYSISIGKLPDGRAVAMSVAIDVTERLAREQEINYLSYHDQLTGLYNRYYYFEQFSKMDKSEFYPIGVVMIDVNGLKIINDAFGHAIGDVALKMLGKVLKESSKEGDIISRIGGDEFAALFTNTSLEELQAYKDEIISKVKTLRVENVELSLAIGYEIKNKVDEDIDEIQKLAENHMYQHKTIVGSSVRSRAINAILQTLTDKYILEREHSHRVSQLSKMIGKELNLMREDEIKALEQSALFHDIGKISIPDSILNKPGKLTNKEYDIIKTHTEVGYQILRAADEFSELAIHALHHHEHWDGSGYPKGLKGNDIPLFSRIICVADAFDAMTSDRPYRKKMSEEYAISEIRRCSGTQFDPAIAKIFIENYVEITKE